MAKNSYAYGQEVTIAGTFKVSGTLTDPTTVTFETLDPLGSVSAYTYALGEITRSSTGIYTKAIAGTISGDWEYYQVGTGACAAAFRGDFHIDQKWVRS